MKLTTIGIDLAKNVLQVHGADDKGKVVVKKQLKRNQVLPFFANLVPCVIGMEACGSAHYWARKLQALGHTVKLMAPQYVKAFVKRNKNDAADAEAICEAVVRPSIPAVPIKNIEQQAILSVHRARQGFVKARTAQANQIRGLLAEYGIAIPKGIFNYFAVPGNSHRLCSFRYEVCRAWRRMLQRRSQRHNQSWERFGYLEKRFIPPFRNTHPYPEERFRVKHPRQEPCAVVPLAGICAGGRG